MVGSRITLLVLATLTLAAGCDEARPNREVDSRIAAGPDARELGIEAYDVAHLAEGEILLVGEAQVVGAAELEGSGVLITTDVDWSPAQYRAVTTDIRESVLGEAPYSVTLEPVDALASPRQIDAPPACSSVGGGWDYCADDEGWCLSQGPSAGYCFYCGTWGSDEVEVGHAC